MSLCIITVIIVIIGIIIITAVLLVLLLFLLLTCHEFLEHIELSLRGTGDIGEINFLRDVEKVFEAWIKYKRLPFLVRGLVKAEALQEAVTTPQLLQGESEELRLHHLSLATAHTEIYILQLDMRERES